MSRRKAEFGGRVGRTIARSESWWPPRPDPSRRPPNVVLILLDDMGFSDVGCFGSEIPTPTIDALADRGVRFTNFHVTPLCSPTRASLLTGLNHHRAGYGMVANGDPGVPNRRSAFPADAVTMPEVLRDAGYATLAVGKWHLTAEADMNDAGSREMWPCQVGFDRFYGFLEAFTTQHHPHRLVIDNSPIETDEYPDGYYLTDDLTDRAEKMLRGIRAADPGKPFFLYFAHAAVHGPLQAKPEDIARHRDRYRAGWDEIRAGRFARQLELGIFPPDTKLPHRNQEPGGDVPAWDELSDREREVFARMMSVYAAMIDSVEQSTARLVSTLEEMGELDDTVFVFLSDNGATAEGGAQGVLRYTKVSPLVEGPPEDLDIDLDELGGPRSFFHYARGWGMVGNTPFRLYKASTHEGGVRSPLIVSWPAGLSGEARGGIRDQFQYVTDLFPTLLDLLDLSVPERRGDEATLALDGASFAAALDDAAAPSTRPEQHEEILGHRSFYRGDWKSVTRHARMTPFEDDRWELYRLSGDPAETEDLAEKMPERVAELAAGWEDAARANEVFPLDEGTGLGQVLRDPAEARFAEDLTILPGTPTIERYRANSLIAFRSFTAEIRFDFDAGDAGVLLAHGGQSAGYVVY
ncbi:MAG: arylsulfatase, partial [Actinobacteria bacterium]|nr:arylsulfatase [Actinomycetota bacterium]